MPSNTPMATTFPGVTGTPDQRSPASPAPTAPDVATKGRAEG